MVTETRTPIILQGLWGTDRHELLVDSEETIIQETSLLIDNGRHAFPVPGIFVISNFLSQYQGTWETKLVVIIVTTANDNNNKQLGLPKVT